MKETENFQLNQWERNDRIQMEDFNRDNAALDAALAAQREAHEALTQTVADQGAAIALLGNCQFVTGSYVGTGTSGKDNPNSLTFPHKPMLVFIQPQERNGYNCDRMILMRDTNWGYGLLKNDGGCDLTWGERSVSWWSTSSSSYHAPEQLNIKELTYCYIALVVKE
ncbi:hypothetical protein [uncultured Dysosmobacter sp.]|uniref:hypothetical protein n=1 Tax=uncultured Dysosmobacter sp. TaxID=2591384 RepID=UPI00262A88ED|nr:hypothetical protein [uncultured Dysosmobacter sp.]